LWILVKYGGMPFAAVAVSSRRVPASVDSPEDDRAVSFEQCPSPSVT
jgi:hypothetical protein